MHLALGGDQHVADHAQALDIGVERAQTVGELLGQHRDDAAREVHAGGAVVGVHVDGAAGLHIVAHVGNGHQQAPALAAPYLGRLAVHGVVEVARVLAVDGDQRHVGQVDALLFVLRAHLVGQGASLGQAVLGKLVRHAVLAHGDLDLHARVVHLTEHFSDAAHRLAEQRGWLGQLHHHHLPGLGGTQGTCGDEDVLPIALVFGSHNPDAALLQQATDDGMRGALQDLGHPAFRASAPVVAHDACAHPVFVQDGTHLVGGEEDIGLSVFTDHEPVAVTVPLHGALDLVGWMQRLGAGVHFFVIQSKSFLKCPGGGIGRRTSFRY